RSASVAREAGRRLERQVQCLRDRVGLGETFEREITELLALLVEQRLGLLLPTLGLDLDSLVFERALLAGLHFFELEHVLAELRLYGSALFTRRHREKRFLERTDKHAAFRPAEVAPLSGRSGIFRVFLRELREIRTPLRLLHELGGLLLRSGVIQSVIGRD